MEKYKHWYILDAMPDGWKIDKNAGSPLFEHEFITNGKSPLKGQQRALLKVDIIHKKHTESIEIVEHTENKKHSTGKNWTFDTQSVKVVNELARKKCQERILKDIMVDLMICEIEGWGKTEYINELKKLIGGLLGSRTKLLKKEFQNHSIADMTGRLF